MAMRCQGLAYNGEDLVAQHTGEISGPHDTAAIHRIREITRAKANGALAGKPARNLQIKIRYLD
jgi:hypothetical protein